MKMKQFVILVIQAFIYITINVILAIKDVRNVNLMNFQMNINVQCALIIIILLLKIIINA